MARIRSSLNYLLPLLAATAPAQIRYEVTPTSDRSKIAVTITIPVKESTTAIQFPSWSPGLYVREDYWKTLGEVTAIDETGQSLPVAHPSRDTWTIPSIGTKTVTFRYERDVRPSNDRFGMFASDKDAIHWTGPSTYAYAVNRAQERCELKLDNSASEQIAVGLVPNSKGVYLASSYDQLADCPVTIGHFKEFHYSVGKKDHQIALRGLARDKIDTDKVQARAQFLSHIETDFFGEVPYPKYTWQIFAVEMRDGGGGVEHASSTDIFLSTGLGYSAFTGMAHEFFHLWNVKRIRSKVLGPFDYQNLPKAGDLWWLEGVTDYYASSLPFRYGGTTQTQWLADLAGNVAAVRSNPARMEVSPFEAGDRVPEATSNSSGYRVNYYPTGWVLGLMFDIEIRSRTQGRFSLDNVEKSLNHLCHRTGSGFGPDEIRRQLVQFGGKDLGSLYDQWVLKPGDLPIDAVLAKAGLEIVGGKCLIAQNAPKEAVAVRESLLKQTTRFPVSGLW